MNSLSPEERSSYRVDMHKMLMEVARGTNLEAPFIHLKHSKLMGQSQQRVGWKACDRGANARLVLVAGAASSRPCTVGTPGSTAPGNGDFGPPGTINQGRLGENEGSENLGSGISPVRKLPVR